MELNKISKESNGGTELMGRRLYESVPKELLDKFQIIMSRVRTLDSDKIRILWLHDLADDPETEHLANEGWKRFHHFVFVSYWQMYQYIDKYKIPHKMCSVILNGIPAIERHAKPRGKTLNLIYFSTPHRGLNILVPVFEKLVEEGYDIHLHVHSTFALYGEAWSIRDMPYADLFKKCEDHPNITLGGAISNEEIREKLKDMHILAYPSTWPETSCLVLIESMMAGLECVHSDFAALPETSGRLTCMYRYSDIVNDHATNFYHALKTVLDTYHDAESATQRDMSYLYATIKYDWDSKSRLWISLLHRLNRANPPREIVHPTNMFNYTVKI